MKLEELQNRLLGLARKNPPGDRVPYAFEKRIMSRLASAGTPNSWALWHGPMWRAAVSCMAITFLCGVWFVASNRSAAADTQESVSQAFEAAVFSPPSQQAEDAW